MIVRMRTYMTLTGVFFVLGRIAWNRKVLFMSHHNSLKPFDHASSSSHSAHTMRLPMLALKTVLLIRVVLVGLALSGP
jgi:hypothetical protein